MWILAVAIAVVSSPVAVDTPMQITACVSVDKGTLYRVKEGTQPSEPCTAGDRTITWSIAGRRQLPGNDESLRGPVHRWKDGEHG